MLECGSNINQSETGTPFYQGLCDVSPGLEWESQDVVTGDACLTTIERTFFGFDGLTCTQIITLVDSEGPVFPEVSDLIVECVEDIPAAMMLTAVDACSGDEISASSFESVGMPTVVCELSTAFGPGADWAVWLQGFSQGASDNFVWDENGGTFDQYADGTAHLYGTVVNDTDASQGWAVDLWFENGVDWTDWSSQGRWYKDDLGFGADEFEDWTYYEMVPFSTLTGTGAFLGDELLLTHNPEDYFFGFQCGLGANNKNANEGFSGWFYYEGNVGGEAVSGNGDVNVDKECAPNDDVPECTNDTQVTYLYRAADGCGNSTVITQVITVSDETAPVFVNPPVDVTLQCDNWQIELPELVELLATENCIGAITYAEPIEIIEVGDCPNNLTITRRWEATDECNNTQVHIQTITVIDEIAPVITCPVDISHECDAPVDYGFATATDNCTDLPAVTVIETEEGDSCNKTITRVFTATDECGNFSECTQTITIIDSTAPVFGEFTPYLSVECTDLDSVEEDITVTDNCNDYSLTYTDVLNSGGCLGVLERTYTATDVCGNSSSIVQYISLQDTTPPVVECPENESYECGQEIPDAEDPVASDNCGLDVSIDFEETIEGDICLTTITRTWTVTDYCDNVTVCTQVISVVDTTDPILDVPADLTFECDAIGEFGVATAIDNCDDEVVIEVTETEVPGDCVADLVITRTFRAFDDCGNSAIAVQTITIVDTTAPVITCPADISHECDTPVDYGFATATDNCQLPEVTVEETESGDSCVRTITRVFTANDGCGNSSSCTQTITIVDSTAPVITCPADISHECDAPVDYGFAIATDNCQTPEVTVDETESGDSCERVITRIFTAIDGCGNSSSCTQTITIVDTTAPVITGLSSLDIPCDAIDENFLASATDNCNELTFTFSDSEVSGGCVGEVIRTYTATDACGNSSEFVQILDLFDDVAPIITCPSDVSYECDADPVPDFGVATATDSCSEPSLTMEDVIAGDGCSTTITRTWTATDDCGNASSCIQTITIVDTTAPVITCPADMSHECDAPVDYGMATATDNCNLFSITSSDVTTGDDCLTIITRTWTATDACGNASDCVQTITIVDTTAPVITCPADVSHECDAPVDYGMAEATDNCNLVTMTFADSTSGDSCETVITRTWTATDACGNASECVQTITIVDTTAPVITGPLTIDMSCDNVDENILVDATDNCNQPNVTITYEDVFVSGGCLGEIIRTYTANDGCGNTSEFIQIIDLFDDEAPTLECPADESYMCTEEVPAAAEPTYSDNCTEVSLSLVETTTGDSCMSVITRVWTATDECGNASTCTQTVTVADTTAPVITCPADVSHECDAPVDYGIATATDNCNLFSITSSDVTAGDGCLTTITRTWTATDACGNSSDCVQTITIVDTTAPVIICPADVSHECDAPVDYGMATATDNCNVFSITSSDATTGDDCLTTITRTWTATDACGNSSDCVQTITIVDTTAPVITCPADVSHECDSPVDYGMASATDNCNLFSVTSSDVTTGDSCETVITRTWTATDACGNASDCVQTITIVDTTAPVITCPADVSHECDVEVDYGVATATDNCSLFSITSSDVTTGDGCLTTITRTWTATDACGNASDCVQTITIVDTTAPVITCPADVSHECDAPVDYGMATATDNCNIFSITSSDVTEGDGCLTTITRTWTATDACGNASECVQTITLVDTTAPVITGEVELDVPCDNIPGISVTATDNCNEITLDFTDELLADECLGSVVRTYTATDICGNSSEFVQTLNLTDNVAPELTSQPADLVLDCEDDVPAPPVVTAIDNCDNDPQVIYSGDVIIGEQPAEGSIADCVLSTPAGPVCHNDPSWSLKLFNFPGYEFFSNVESSFVEYEDGTAVLTGRVQATNNPNAFFDIDVTFENGMNWEDWSNQTFPTSFKDDCETAEDSEVYLDWTYYIMQAGNATLTGAGDLEGSLFNLVHAPINDYYGYQVGNGANNVNSNYGNGGWFTGTGLLVDAATETQVELSDFQGDFAFDADCCPQYTIERTWYAMDCSGNTSSMWTQTISFEELEEDEEVSETETTTVSFDTVEGDLFIGNIFPNPVNDRAQINYGVAKTSNVTLDVLDMNGNLVQTIFTGSAEAGVTYQQMFEVAGIESGVYMVRLTGNNTAKFERVVVAK